jgi:hypothetical protein
MALAEQIGFVAIDSGVLRNAQLIAGLGDFIRFIIIGQRQRFSTVEISKLLELSWWNWDIEMITKALSLIMANRIDALDEFYKTHVVAFHPSNQ